MKLTTHLSKQPTDVDVQTVRRQWSGDVGDTKTAAAKRSKLKGGQMDPCSRRRHGSSDSSCALHLQLHSRRHAVSHKPWRLSHTALPPSTRRVCEFASLTYCYHCAVVCLLGLRPARISCGELHHHPFDPTSARALQERCKSVSYGRRECSHAHGDYRWAAPARGLPEAAQGAPGTNAPRPRRRAK